MHLLHTLPLLLLQIRSYHTPKRQAEAVALNDALRLSVVICCGQRVTFSKGGTRRFDLPNGLFPAALHPGCPLF